MNDQAIAIFHHRGDNNIWMNDLLDSLQTIYPIIITNHDGWQIDAVRETFERTNFSEIFFLNETMIIKDNSIWDIIFKRYEGHSVASSVHYQMFLGKYLRRIVEQTVFPTVDNRKDDIIFGEDLWNKQYMSLDTNIIFYHPLSDPNPSGNKQFKHGRENLVLENEYFRKWKHQWHLDMVK